MTCHILFGGIYLSWGIVTLVGAFDDGVQIKSHELVFLFSFSIYPHNFSKICFYPFKHISLSNYPFRLLCVCVPIQVLIFFFYTVHILASNTSTHTHTHTECPCAIYLYIAELHITGHCQHKLKSCDILIYKIPMIQEFCFYLGIDIHPKQNRILFLFTWDISINGIDN